MTVTGLEELAELGLQVLSRRERDRGYQVIGATILCNRPQGTRMSTIVARATVLARPGLRHDRVIVAHLFRGYDSDAIEHRTVMQFRHDQLAVIIEALGRALEGPPAANHASNARARARLARRRRPSDG